MKLSISLSPRLRSSKGLTLIELICAIVVLGIAVPAIAYLFNVAYLASADSVVTVQAHLLANSLMNEISERRFMESVAHPGNGPDTNEVSSYSRLNFNDIDDYNQFALSWGELNPPRDESGTAMNAFSQYTQYVEVYNVAPPALNFPNRAFTKQNDGTTDFKLVTVTIASLKTKESVTLYKVFAKP